MSLVPIMFLLVIITQITAAISVDADENADTDSNSLKGDVVERFIDIPTTPKDRREYRGLKLRNGMKVLLVSDPSTEKSAASLALEVGPLYDFPEVPGLANFVGYLLTREHKKNEQFFDKFVESHGGLTELGRTRPNSQFYSFEIDAMLFAGTLRRFARFFTRPSIFKSCLEVVLEDTVSCLDRDFQHYSQTDTFRILHTEKLMAKPNHAYSHFFSGNAKTLYQHVKNSSGAPFEGCPDPKRKSLYEKAQKFHSRWYSADVMNLVVLGKENLDQLEEMVVPLFKDVENKTVTKITYTYQYHALGPEQMKNKMYILPLLDGVQVLRLIFPVPDVQGQYKTSPETYLSYFFMNEEHGSLISALRKRKLCTNLMVECSSIFGLGFFAIICDLTDTGVKRVDDVINLIFQYIYFFWDKGVREMYFREFEAYQILSFLNYVPDEPPISYVKTLALNLQSFPIPDILLCHFLQNEWKPSLINDLLSYLRPDNVNVSVISKLIEKHAIYEELHTKTKYGIEKISEELIEKWKTRERISEFQMPPPNEFLPRNLDLYPLGEKEPEYPYVIHESPLSEIWFKQDDNFKTPFLSIELEIFCSTKRHGGPFEIFFWNIFVAELISLLKENFFSAYSIGSLVEVQLSDYGVLVMISGFNDTLLILLEKVLFRVINLKNDFNQNTFKINQKEFIKNLNSDMTDHFSQIDWLTDHTLNEDNWAADQVLKAAKLSRFTDMKKFLKKVFRRVFVRGQIYGNCTKQKAPDYIDIIEKLFHTNRVLLQQEVLSPRVVEFELKNGSEYIYQVFNEKRNIFGYSSYFRLSYQTSSSRHDISGSLLYDIVVDKCHELMHETKKKKVLPEVKCDLMEIVNARDQAFRISVVSEKDLRHVESKVEKFVQNIPNLLELITPGEFERFKNNLKTNEYAMPSHLAEMARRYWIEIKSRQYGFEKFVTEPEQLLALTKTDLINFSKKMLDPSSPRRQKFILEINPRSDKKQKLKAVTRPLDKKVIKIEDLDAFKTTLNLLPLY